MNYTTIIELAESLPRLSCRSLAKTGYQLEPLLRLFYLCVAPTIGFAAWGHAAYRLRWGIHIVDRVPPAGVPGRCRSSVPICEIYG